MAGLQQQAANAILEDPAVDTLSSFIGVDGANNSMLHTGQMLINLKKDRSGSQEKIMQRLRGRVAEVPGVTSISSRPRT
jgi:multidrug efflux pump